MMSLLWFPVKYVLRLIEKILFVMILLYDSYCYSPLQSTLSPIVAKVPRYIKHGDQKWTIFTANIVSWSRTVLVIPVAICLKFGFNTTAFVCVIFHDFLDHLDGIVAKTQKKIYGEVDDPLLGGFMDAFCDKIVNCLCLWTILMVTDFSLMSTMQTCVFVGSCSIVITYEFILGVVRVQDYFQAFYRRKYNDMSMNTQPNIAAVMEGKLKEKLESLGIGCLCLCQSSLNPLQSYAGIIGIACLVFSIRLAHASLLHKLKARQSQDEHVKTEPSQDLTSTNTQTEDTQWSVDLKRRQSVFDDLSDESDDENSEVDEKWDTTSEKIENDNNTGGRKRTLSRSMSVPSWKPSVKVDKVYTVGCFDLFHEGHKKLLKRLKKIGTQVIVGVHDSRSIFKLKQKVPIDGTGKRMANVNRYADIVFCIHGTDPSPYIQCIFDHSDGISSMYVRGDDMENFPARDVTEKLMPVHFLPYTQSVSSTKIRKDIYNASRFGPHLHHDDHTMFY